MSGCPLLQKVLRCPTYTTTRWVPCHKYIQRWADVNSLKKKTPYTSAHHLPTVSNTVDTQHIYFTSNTVMKARLHKSSGNEEKGRTPDIWNYQHPFTFSIMNLITFFQYLNFVLLFKVFPYITGWQTILWSTDPAYYLMSFYSLPSKNGFYIFN